jgi:glycosyltransferase involved in cell wall biosynthesis
VKSALSQKTDFPFNIIVVDNHSTDGTTAILSKLTKQSPRLKHIIPKRTDLGIGGCWNEAIQAEACGRYAIQLDSDDLWVRGKLKILAMTALDKNLRQETEKILEGLG